ncbi:MAG: hypothetical protein QNJ72_12445 [Pleurocapsa sp. MO_226.B13]|nr:hypothetical protein [Pleurocapsa sp. MO_226.B13]
MLYSHIRCGVSEITERLARRTECKAFGIYRDVAVGLGRSQYADISLRHIQEISGHNDMGTLQRYLEVSLEQKRKAVSVIGW